MCYTCEILGIIHISTSDVLLHIFSCAENASKYEVKGEKPVNIFSEHMRIIVVYSTKVTTI